MVPGGVSTLGFGEALCEGVLDDAVRGSSQGLDGAVVAAPGSLVFLEEVPQGHANPDIDLDAGLLAVDWGGVHHPVEVEALAAVDRLGRRGTIAKDDRPGPKRRGNHSTIAPRHHKTIGGTRGGRRSGRLAQESSVGERR